MFFRQYTVFIPVLSASGWLPLVTGAGAPGDQGKGY
jgi:hypothetical protein